MTKYLLFLKGSIKSKKLNKITSNLDEIITSDFLKFRLYEGFSVFHFGVNIPFKRLKSIIDNGLKDITDVYFLMKNDKNSIFKMPEEELSLFSTIDEISLDQSINDKLNKTLLEQYDDIDDLLKSLIQPIDYDEEEDDDNGDELINKLKRKQLNVDDILDKISYSGKSSLTAKEINFLKKI